MVRVINYFDTQVRVPTSATAAAAAAMNGKAKDAKYTFEEHMSDPSTRAMTDEQKVSWYGKVLDSVRLRYRKLQRFAR